MKTWHYVVLAYLGWAWYRSNKAGTPLIEALTRPFATVENLQAAHPATVGIVFARDGETFEGSIIASTKVDPLVGEMIRAYAMGQASGNPLNQV